MLSVENQGLCQRDQLLPGLAFILDVDRVARAVVNHFPEMVEAEVRLDYLRYKPLRRCIGLFELRCPPSATSSAKEVKHLVVTARTVDGWNKFVATGRAASPRDQGSLLIPDLYLSLEWFPNDHALKNVTKLFDCSRQATVLRRILDDSTIEGSLNLTQLNLATLNLSTLAYKPGRRYVACGSIDHVPLYTLKVYTPSGFAQAEKTIRLVDRCGLTSSKLLGASPRYCSIATSWVPGNLLANCLSQPSATDGDDGVGQLAEYVAQTGRRLAEWHARGRKFLYSERLNRNENCQAAALGELERDIALLAPVLAQRTHRLVSALNDRLAKMPEASDWIHGDFYAKQVILSPKPAGLESDVEFIDFDEVSVGDCCQDLGNFIAQTLWSSTRGLVSAALAEATIAQFLRGYAEAGGVIEDDRLATYVAASLLRCSPHAFRRVCDGTDASRRRDIRNGVERTWTDGIQRMLALAEAWLDNAVGRSGSAPHAQAAAEMVLDCEAVNRRFQSAGIHSGIHSSGIHLHSALQGCRVESARCLRHKPTKRMLIEYCLAKTSLSEGEISEGEVTVLGKVRLSKGIDRRTPELHDRLIAQGWGDRSRTRVPRALGLIPEWNMWLQEKVDGQGITCDPTTPLAAHAQVAMGLADLHKVKLVVDRVHTPEKEIAVLKELFSELTGQRPEVGHQLQTILEVCREAISRLPRSPEVLIHRDFYFDQVLIANGQVFLLDLDLACMGPAELDVGNYLAHLDEFALRVPANAAYCERAATLFLKSYLRESPQADANAVAIWRDVALARHIAISHRMDGRRHVTLPLIQRYFEYCMNFCAV